MDSINETSVSSVEEMLRNPYTKRIWYLLHKKLKSAYFPSSKILATGEKLTDLCIKSGVKFIYTDKPEICGGLFSGGKVGLKEGICSVRTGKRFFDDQRYLVFYPAVLNTSMEEVRSKKLCWQKPDEIDTARPFYATRTCCGSVRPVLSFMKKMNMQGITYGEFSCACGGTLRKILPFCKKIYTTDFYLFTEILKARLEKDRVRADISIDSLADDSSLEFVLKDYLRKNVHFDVIFYDADHSRRFPVVFSLMKKLSNYLIVHDVNFEAVRNDCDEILGNMPYIKDISYLGTETRIYSITGKPLPDSI